MKRKILSAVIYATAAFALGQYFDSLFAGEPAKHSVLVYAGIAGTILFVAACAFSLFAKRAGLACGLAGAVLSWPGLAITIPKIPWNGIGSIFPDSNWADLLTAIFTLAVSSAYSINELRPSLRSEGDIQNRNVGTMLVVGLSYAAGVFFVTNWRGIWDWLFRLRYGN